MNYLEEDLKIVDTLNRQFQVLAQSFVVANTMTVLLQKYKQKQNYFLQPLSIITE